MKFVIIDRALRNYFKSCPSIIPFKKRDAMAKLQLFGGSWTEDKLQRVKAYLKAYTTALKNKPTQENPFTLVYVDAFAGTGYRDKEAIDNNGDFLFQDQAGDDYKEFHDGSARIALENDPPFSKYYFIEIDPVKCQELEKLKELYPSKANKIEILNEDANSAISRICDIFNCNRSYRGVIFIDPFAMSASWSSIEKIAATKALDMWYLFPISAVNRLVTKDGFKQPEKWKSRVNDIFGNNDWEKEFYTNHEDKDLFGNKETIIKKIANFKKIEEYLSRKLGVVFEGVAKNPLTLYNNRKSPLFLLCFTCGNPNGKDIALRIAEHILKKDKW